MTETTHLIRPKQLNPSIRLKLHKHDYHGPFGYSLFSWYKAYVYSDLILNLSADEWDRLKTILPLEDRFKKKYMIWVGVECYLK